MYWPNSPNLLLGGATRPRQSIMSMTLNVNNATGSIVMFTVTGVVQVNALWGEVTTVISANHTAGFVRLNDQTTQTAITLATGITLSGLLAGTTFFRSLLASGLLKLMDNAAGTFFEPAAAATPANIPFIVGKKSGAVTTVDYRYTTTDAPSSGVIRWNALWTPLTGDGNLA